jgi:hypothetical protein
MQSYLVAWPSLLVAGDITKWYHRKDSHSGSDIARPFDGWGHYKWYQIQGFNTEPGWAMLVEVEAKVLENNCC